VGLLADIGLFCLLSEYQLFLARGNYIDQTIILTLLEAKCSETSLHVLKCWGFDTDFQEVASNRYQTDKEHVVSYLDIAQIAHYLLLSRKQDKSIEDQEIELNTDGVQVLYEYSNKSHHEFDALVTEVVSCSGF